jgi:hypothetical protein
MGMAVFFPREAAHLIWVAGKAPKGFDPAKQLLVDLR